MNGDQAALRKAMKARRTKLTEKDIADGGAVIAKKYVRWKPTAAAAGCGVI